MLGLERRTHSKKIPVHLATDMVTEGGGMKATLPNHVLLRQLEAPTSDSLSDLIFERLHTRRNAARTCFVRAQGLWLWKAYTHHGKIASCCFGNSTRSSRSQPQCRLQNSNDSPEIPTIPRVLLQSLTHSNKLPRTRVYMLVSMPIPLMWICR